MRHPSRLAVAIACIATWVAIPGPHARADAYFDIYGGLAGSEERRLTAEQPQDGLAATITPNYDASFSGGVRWGFWLGGNPWLGFAGDMSYFRAEATGVAIDVYSISPMFMARVPLAHDPDHPGGRVNAYGGLGPSLYYFETETDLRPALTRSMGLDSIGVGFQFLAGLSFRVSDGVSLFGEYRFTHRRIEADDLDSRFCILFFCPVTDKVDTTLETHHLLAGVTFWF